MGPGYQAILGIHVQNEMKMKISHKARKERKPCTKKPSPKKRDEKDAWMGWSNQDPPITTYIQYVQESNEKKKTS